MQATVLCDVIKSCDNLSTPFSWISHLLIKDWKRKKLIKDKRKDHGALDESPSEQQFHKIDTIIFLLWKIWSHSISSTRFYSRLAGWLADEIVLNLETLKLYTRWNIQLFAMFNKGMVLLWSYQWVLVNFLHKAHCKVDFGQAKIWMPFFWAISTTILNDKYVATHCS